MLDLLQIRDLAIISDQTIEFRPGLNVLTGETGAGKSIILGALGLILGERAQSDAVRTGSERAEVQAIFEAGSDRRVAAFLRDNGLEPPEDGRLIIRREVFRAGKSRCQINGTFVTVQTLAALGDLIVDLHGQHEHQSLLHGPEQRILLDAFGRGHDGALEQYRLAFERLRAARERLAGLQEGTRDRDRRLDLLRFELEEIESANLEEGEFARIEAEVKRLGNADKLLRMAGEAFTLLDEGDGQTESLLAQLGRVEQLLEALAAMDAEGGAAVLRPLVEGRVLLEESAYALRDYNQSLQCDPERLAEAQERQDLLRRLRRKYGETEAEIVELAAHHREELNRAESREEEEAAAQAERDAAQAAVAAAAARLSEARRTAGKKLQRAIERELDDLLMKGTRFEARLEPLPEPGAEGAEGVAFYLAANAGEEPRPLKRVASGGELSRLMLALKTVDAQERHLPTMVFDEIDAGIGGIAADRVGAKVGSLAARQQILCITHLPQIAALGAHHLHVSKATRKGRTETRVETLGTAERLQELARMIGGERAGKESIATARALLQAAGHAVE